MSLLPPLEQSADDSRTYAVTAVSKALIDVVARDVAAFRFHNHAAFHLVGRFSTICKKVEELVQAIESGPGDNWDAYDKYTPAIDPLEESLFKLVVSVEIHQKGHTAQFESPTTITDHLELVSIWEKQRRELRDTLIKLPPTLSQFVSSTSDQDLKALYKRDDVKFVTEIVQKVELQRAGNRSKKGADIESHLQTTITRIQPISKAITSRYDDWDDDSVTIYVKSIMIVCWMLERVLSESSGFSNERKVISDCISAFLPTVQQFVQGGRNAPRASDVTQAYEAYVRVIQECMGFRVPENYNYIMAWAGRISRSYHSQTLYAIGLCRELVQQAQSNQWDPAPLTLAIDSTVNALKAAVNKDGNLVKVEPGVYDNDTTSITFKKAYDELKRCYAQYGLSSSWSEREKELARCIERDRYRIGQVNEILEVVSTSRKNRVPVEVKICQDSVSKVIQVTKYLAWPNTRLSAIQLQASTEQFKTASIGERILSQNSYFVKTSQPRYKLGSDADVQSLLDRGGSTCDLTLVAVA